MKNTYTVSNNSKNMKLKKIDSNDIENKFINVSVFDTHKKLIILIIVSWACFGLAISVILISIFAIFFSIMAAMIIFTIGYVALWAAFLSIIIASFIIGVQLIRKQKIAYGVCILLFGWISLGIWPLIASIMDRRDKEPKLFDVTSEKFIKSLIMCYDISKIILIMGLFACIFDISFIITVVGGFFVAIQDFRRSRLMHGGCVLLFGWMSLGLWPLIYATKQCKKLRENILDNEISSLEIECRCSNDNSHMTNLEELRHIHFLDDMQKNTIEQEELKIISTTYVSCGRY